VIAYLHNLSIKEVLIKNEDGLPGFCEYDYLFGYNTIPLKVYDKDLLKLEKTSFK